MQPPDPSEPITILGAGIVGICTALSLLDRGYLVRVIDRGQPGQETSRGNAGVISPWSIIPQATPGVWKSIPKLMFGRDRPLSVRTHSWPAMVPWGLRFLRKSSETTTRQTSAAMSILCGPSIELFRKHLTGTGQDHLIKDSAYIHAVRDPERADLSSLEYQIRIEHGGNLERVGAKQLRLLEPALSTEFQAAIVIHDQARALSPGRIATVLAEKAKRLGAVFVQDTISALTRDGETWRLLGREDTYSSTTVILSLGAWSADILKPLGFQVPLMAERGYNVEFETTELEVHNSIMDTDAKVVASSMEHGLRVAGQAEFAPVDAPADPARKRRMTEIAKRMFPDLPSDATSVWMGRRPSFPDSLPALGPAPGCPGLVLNFGHSHYGLMMAPKSGELVAAQITGTSPNEDVSPFSISRFS